MTHLDTAVAAADISTRGAGLGLVGGIVFTSIVVASVFLVRNMNARIKRLPQDPGPSGADGHEAAPDRDRPTA
jgi:hypothetical protein